MDNVGGHGTTKVKKEYVSTFQEKFNTIIFWQMPNSPETNLLDLGMWHSSPICCQIGEFPEED